MGEYLVKLNAVKMMIYRNQLDDAANSLKALLNKLNAEYTTMPSSIEKNKRKKAIMILLPVLNDLKAHNITPNVIVTLKLDYTRLNNKPASKPVETPVSPVVSIPTPEVLPDEPTKVEEPKEEAKPKIIRKRPRKELTPLTFDDYIGQEKAKEGLKIAIEAAKKENRVLNHLLICSSYGLGKTTLANIIANEMDLPFFTINATNLKDPKALSLYFSKITESCIIFIDEIHSLSKDVQTVLLSILQDFQVSFITNEGKEQFFELPPFTLIGATTQAGELLKPFGNRFTIVDLVDYTDTERDILVNSKFQKLGYEIEEAAVKQVSKRSRGIPRTIEIFAKGIRDVALTKNTKVVTEDIAKQYFDMYEIDDNGLSKNDLSILEALAKSSKPIGLITLESKTGIQKEDLEYRHEPYLIKLGLIEKTERGRIITPDGLKYLNGEESVEEAPDPEEPVVEEPVVETPVVEEPAPETPVTEEPVPEVEPVETPTEEKVEESTPEEEVEEPTLEKEAEIPSETPSVEVPSKEETPSETEDSNEEDSNK